MLGNTTLAFKALLLIRENPHAPSYDSSACVIAATTLAVAVTCPLEFGAMHCFRNLWRGLERTMSAGIQEIPGRPTRRSHSTRTNLGRREAGNYRESTSSVKSEKQEFSRPERDLLKPLAAGNVGKKVDNGVERNGKEERLSPNTPWPVNGSEKATGRRNQRQRDSCLWRVEVEVRM